MGREHTKAALERAIAKIARQDEFLKKVMALRNEPNPYEYAPATYDALTALKKGDCDEARKLLRIAKTGHDENGDDLDYGTEDPKLVHKAEKALKRVCAKKSR